MKIKAIDKGQAFDFGKTSAAYAQYRDIYPGELYDRLRSLGVAADGTVWLDLGTGTGVLPKNLYNPKASITGVDISEEQIQFAREEAEKSGWDITYVVSPAETTDLPDGGFDVITAAQCFWYFNREKMQSEIKRLLKPGGSFIKIYMSYTLDDKIAIKSHKLVKKMNRNWTPNASGSRDVYDDLFPGRQTETFYADLPFTRESWHGRMCACRGTLASMDEKTLKKWEKKHLRFLKRCPESFTIRHKIYYSRFVIS
ncbi:MAG: class I SAM-dependent methyltransferase [Oscillospiraceae bacterium]|nr:class I SAM-dependent methyltransferase [Oscillospiraceae bacterium]